MDGSQFDDLTRALTESRRWLLKGALAAGAGLLVVPSVEAKKKKRKHKKRKPRATPNAFGCLDVGDACTDADQCCAGICEGKQGKKRCRAHDSGTCDQALPGICTAPSGAQSACNNRGDCGCFRTTAGSNFCAFSPNTVCADCNSDADCLALGLPPGSACTPFAEGLCTGMCEGGRACMPPCESEPLRS